MTLFSFQKPYWSLKKPCYLNNVIISKEVPWGYFNEAIQERAQSCGMGFVLYFSKKHYITRKSNIGQGMNNQREFNALFALLKCAKDINIVVLQEFRDFKLLEYLDT